MATNNSNDIHITNEYIPKDTNNIIRAILHLRKHIQPTKYPLQATKHKKINDRQDETMKIGLVLIIMTLGGIGATLMRIIYVTITERKWKKKKHNKY